MPVMKNKKMQYRSTIASYLYYFSKRQLGETSTLTYNKMCISVLDHFLALVHFTLGLLGPFHYYCLSGPCLALAAQCDQRFSFI